MGNSTITNENGNEVTLTVFKNSPHIWAGGLEGEELACWLIGKASAIRYAAAKQAQVGQYQNFIREIQESESLREAYVRLGLSHKETDPILPLSAEAIQFDMDAGGFELVHKQCAVDIVIPPVGYSLLPDLVEEQAEFHRKKGAISAQDSSQFLGTENE